MAPKALIFLASGAEEMEFVISADVLARGGVEVTITGVPECTLVKCSRGVRIQPDVCIADAAKRIPFDVIVLPGGLGGSKAMAQSKEVGELLKEQEASGRHIAAICAAPLALKAHGIARGKNLTSYPSVKNELLDGDHGYQYKEEKVVIDGTIITSRGPGTAFDFALAIVEKLQGKEKAQEVAKGMLLSC
ncbi:protein dj-1beta [Diorhabda sublineata]|uniref:protein dj-1beta n=1 Tax=Diorhabda sublineata TaxID=1163346 RepID=UPI0024E106D4|nr:protein dj-1beta [Diorhabda sublineata]XP_056633375.1 protein dj-1beta [Diorhabda sublineata]